MTTSTLTTRVAAPRVDAAIDRTRLLALVAPLLLFTHGILVWVDELGAAPEGFDAQPASRGVLTIVAGAVLVLAVAAFAALANAVSGRAGRPELALPVTLLAAFGAGATAAVWLGRSTGWLADPLPSGLAAGGAVLAGLALAVALVREGIEGRMPFGSLVLTGAAGLLLAVPLGLEPLGALVLLIAVAPLLRTPE